MTSTPSPDPARYVSPVCRDGSHQACANFRGTCRCTCHAAAVEGTERPDTAALLTIGDWLLRTLPGHQGAEQTAAALAYTVRWIDAQPPVPPTRPANYDHTRAAESEAIAKATYALGDHLHPWEDASFDLTESYIGAVCEAMDEFPVPPTPTPCPYIVTGGEGTSYCSLAERSAMHAAAPPSTPADPRPTDLTGSEA